MTGIASTRTSWCWIRAPRRLFRWRIAILDLAVGYDPSSPQKDLSFSDVDNAGSAPKCVIPYEDFDWHGDQPLRLPWTSTVIYELHVRGYTIDPSAGVQSPGTYRGLIQKIPYLKDLGVTAVELMPVQEFNEHDSLRINPKTGERLRNFWGYDPVSFFAPKASYASVREDGAQVLEFKEMVRAFHREGLEVILDVVFNHTGEGDELGPTLSFRGIDNAIYYWLADDKRYYRNFTGTGQTVNASHPVVRDLILDALRYWVMEMHVDGFRFDLASVLGRDVRGHVLADAPLLERIAEDPILRDAKLIAEAWDAAGAYQVGCFSQRRWAEWNGHFRDDVRRFWRGDAGMMGRFASRICGSSDLYAGSGKGPGVQHQLRHLPRRLHVERSGELLAKTQRGQRRGQSGRRRRELQRELRRRRRIRGPGHRGRSPAADQELPADAGDLQRRADAPGGRRVPPNPAGQQQRVLPGQRDELGRLVARPAASRNSCGFARQVFAFRRAHAVLRREAFYGDRDIQWFDPSGRSPDWLDPSQKRLACLIRGQDGPDLYLMFNADPPPEGGGGQTQTHTVLVFGRKKNPNETTRRWRAGGLLREKKVK